MNLEQKIAAVCALHDPSALDEPMVYEVWQDGEITLTKGGDLYGQRHLHMISIGVSEHSLPFDSLPLKNSNHSRIAVKTADQANAAKTIICGPCEWSSTGRWLA